MSLMKQDTENYKLHVVRVLSRSQSVEMCARRDPAATAHKFYR